MTCSLPPPFLNPLLPLGKYSCGGCICHCYICSAPPFIGSLSIVEFHWPFLGDWVPATEPVGLSSRSFPAELKSWKRKLRIPHKLRSKLRGPGWQVWKAFGTGWVSQVTADGHHTQSAKGVGEKQERQLPTSPLPLPHSFPHWWFWAVNQRPAGIHTCS